MLHTIYIACPRGHYYRAGRMTPGLVLRVRGTCPVCRDFQITTGVVTPFSPEIMQLRTPHLLSSIRADEVRQALRNLSERSDVASVLQRIPRGPACLSIHDVLLALDVWMRHRGHSGGILPERNQEVEILAGTNNPAVSMAYLQDRRTHKPAPRYGAPQDAPVLPWLMRLTDYTETIRARLPLLVETIRARLPLLVESVGKELRRLPLLLNRL